MIRGGSLLMLSSRDLAYLKYTRRAMKSRPTTSGALIQSFQGFMNSMPMTISLKSSRPDRDPFWLGLFFPCIGGVLGVISWENRGRVWRVRSSTELKRWTGMISFPRPVHFFRPSLPLKHHSPSLSLSHRIEATSGNSTSLTTAQWNRR